MSAEHNCIYVASLSDYNAGILHGVWIDFDDYYNEEQILDAIYDMLSCSPLAKKEGRKAEEWAIHDYEGFGGIEIDEGETIEDLWRVYTLIGDLDEQEGFIDYLFYNGISRADRITESTIDEFQYSYCGRYKSKEEFAKELINNMGILNGADELLSRYFDYGAFARDLFMLNYYMTEKGYVFSSC